ncbi:hypothetical protein D3C81_1905230 [compost metagenome]
MAVDDCVPLLVGHLLDHAVPGVAGVVDDDVQPLVVLDRGADEALGEVRRTNAADTGHGFAAEGLDRLDHFLRRIGIEVVDHHAGAVGGQLQGDGAADATAGAGNQRHFTFEFLAHLSVLEKGKKEKVLSRWRPVHRRRSWPGRTG